MTNHERLRCSPRTPNVVGAASGAILPTTLPTLPTTPVNITAQGTILGTFQYMAPGQLEGADADARTDIFAFGAVVYEMVTGRKAFEGKSQVSLIGAILERDPAPIAALVPGVPAALDRIVTRCLAKDPDRRWQTASDLGGGAEEIASRRARSSFGVRGRITTVRRSRDFAVVRGSIRIGMERRTSRLLSIP